jgi:hypothetical protein
MLGSPEHTHTHTHTHIHTCDATLALCSLSFLDYQISRSASSWNPSWLREKGMHSAPLDFCLSCKKLWTTPV